MKLKIAEATVFVGNSLRIGPVKFGDSTQKVLELLGKPDELFQTDDRTMIAGEWVDHQVDVLDYRVYLLFLGWCQ